MKNGLIALILLVSAMLSAHADEYIFQYHRFGQIRLETHPGKENIVIEYSEKDGPLKTIFTSKLVPAGPGVFKTAGNTIFTLNHLDEPVTNDGNRHINSGDWQLTVSGHGEEFLHLKPQLPTVAFGTTPPFVYLGRKLDQ